MIHRPRTVPARAARLAAWASGLIVVLVCSNVVAQGSGEVPIHISGRTAVVDVHVNGQGPYRFLIDTGSLHSRIDSKLAGELDLQIADANSRTGDESSTTADDSTRHYRIGSLRLGALELSDVIAKGWESHPFSPGSEAPQGILGTSLFEGALVTIDNPGRILTVEPGALPQADGANVLAYELQDEAPTVQARIGDVQLRLEIHSGGFGPLQLRPERHHELALRTPPARIGNVSIHGVTGDILGSRIEGALTLGRHVVERPSVYFCEAYPADHLGSGALSNFVITLDSANKRIRLQADQSADELLALRAAAVPNLNEGSSALREAFNRDPDKTRLIVILSPT